MNDVELHFVSRKVLHCKWSSLSMKEVVGNPRKAALVFECVLPDGKIRLRPQKQNDINNCLTWEMEYFSDPVFATAIGATVAVAPASAASASDFDESSEEDSENDLEESGANSKKPVAKKADHRSTPSIVAREDNAGNHLPVGGGNSNTVHEKKGGGNPTTAPSRHVASADASPAPVAAAVADTARSSKASNDNKPSGKKPKGTKPSGKKPNKKK